MDLNINDLTIGQIREISCLLSPKGESSFFKIGKAYLIRTVTMINTGEVVAVNDQEILLKSAAWIADTGRYYDALSKGELKEVEPYPNGVCIIGRGAIVDAAEWTNDLPRSQK